MDNRPIGFFDSGLGGLTCIPNLFRQLPEERIIYFGDTARTPYGSKAVSTIRHYAAQIADFLAAQNVKMMVIACNTITATCLDELRARYPSIPIIGIISPAAKTIARTCDETNRIGVIASLGTTITPTVNFLRAKAAQRGKDPRIVSCVAEGAYEALNAGDSAKHDALITEAAKKLAKEADVILLAQGSMARLEEPLNKVIPVPVLSSPKNCALAVKKALGL